MTKDQSFSRAVCFARIYARLLVVDVVLRVELSIDFIMISHDFHLIFMAQWEAPGKALGDAPEEASDSPWEGP